MTRREDAAAEIEAAGASGVVCDVFDAEALRRVVAEADPEVVIHELTALPADLDLRKRGVYDANNRIRREGTRNLIAAARAAGARRLVAQSVAFLYAPTGGWVKTEDDPVMTEAPGEFGESLAATLEHEANVLGSRGTRGRGPALRLLLRARDVLCRRRLSGVGGAPAPLSDRRRRRRSLLVHPHRRRGSGDRRRGRARRAGIYNVCDDEPAPIRDWVPAYAEAIGAKPPRRVPAWLARLVAGRAAVELRDHPARRLEREGEGRARLAARATRAGARGSPKRSADPLG